MNKKLFSVIIIISIALTTLVIPNVFASKDDNPRASQLVGYLEIEAEKGVLEISVYLKNNGNNSTEITFNNQNYTYNLIIEKQGKEIFNLEKEKIKEGLDIYSQNPITITLKSGEEYKLGEHELKNLEEGEYQIRAEIFTNPIIKVKKQVSVKSTDKKDDNKDDDTQDSQKVNLQISMIAPHYHQNVLTATIAINNPTDKQQELYFFNKNFLFNVVIKDEETDTLIFDLSKYMLQNDIDIHARNPIAITFPPSSSHYLGNFSASLTPGSYKIVISTNSKPSITWSGYVYISANGTVSISDKEEEHEDREEKNKENYQIRHHAGIISVILKTKATMLINSTTASFTVYLRNNSTATLDIDTSKAEHEVEIYAHRNKEDYKEITASSTFTSSLPYHLTLKPREIVNVGTINIELPQQNDNIEYLIIFKLENIYTDGTPIEEIGVKLEIKYFSKKPSVSAPSWAEEYLQKAIEYGLIYVPNDGQITGTMPALRRDVIYTAAAIAGIESVDVATITPWSDVTATDPMSGIFLSLYEKDLLKGYPDGTLRPDKPVTRAEAITLFLRIIAPEKIKDKQIKYQHEFADVEEDTWYAKYVELAYRMGLVKGDGKGNFLPNKNINLNELAVIALRAYNYFHREDD